MSHSPFLDKVREAVRVRHYARTTEKTYVHWVKCFILFHGKRHPKDMGETEVRSFLSDLAVRKRVAPATQNQALCALVFLYKSVLDKPLGEMQGLVWAKSRQHIPVVLSTEEVAAILGQLRGTHWLIAGLQYGSGLRLRESIRLRVHDLDFLRRAMVVRHGKGGKDRVVTLAGQLLTPLRRHLARRQDLFDADRTAGFGTVSLPWALARKYPRAESEWGWQFVFPSSRIGADPVSAIRRRHHIHASAVQKAIKTAVRATGIPKRATCHTLRHSFATHLLEGGADIRFPSLSLLIDHTGVSMTAVILLPARFRDRPALTHPKLGNPSLTENLNLELRHFKENIGLRERP